jgi:hypothetical protein
MKDEEVKLEEIDTSHTLCTSLKVSMFRGHKLLFYKARGTENASFLFFFIIRG